MFKYKQCNNQVRPDYVVCYHVDDVSKDPRAVIDETTEYENYEILEESNLEEEYKERDSRNCTESIRKSNDVSKDPRAVIDETTEYEDYEILEESNLEEEYKESDSRNCMESIKKSSAVWTKNATLSLLSLYDANIDKLDHTNKKTKLWNTISLHLKLINLPYSPNQVKWKMNALLSKYKSCFDNNSKSGREYQTFDYYDIIDEIMQKKNKKLTATSSIRSSNPLKSINNSLLTNLSPKTDSIDLTNEGKAVEKENVNEENISDTCSNSSKDKNKVTPRGTGSKLARQKIALEQEWLKHLKMNEIKAKADAEFRQKYLIQKNEQNQLKKQYLQLRTKELEQKREVEMQKLKSKQRRHEDILDMIKSLGKNNAKRQNENANDTD